MQNKVIAFIYFICLCDSLVQEEEKEIEYENQHVRSYGLRKWGYYIDARNREEWMRAQIEDMEKEWPVREGWIVVGGTGKEKRKIGGKKKK